MSETFDITTLMREYKNLTAITFSILICSLTSIVLSIFSLKKSYGIPIYLYSLFVTTLIIILRPNIEVFTVNPIETTMSNVSNMPNINNISTV